MGSMFSSGSTSKIEVTVRNGDKVQRFTDIKLDNPTDTQLPQLMLELDGHDVEIIFFSLSTSDKQTYTPSEERLMRLIEMIEAHKNRKGLEKKEQQPLVMIKTMVIDLTLDNKTKDLTAKMMMMHMALIMSKLGVRCESMCLMGTMLEFKSIFDKLNDMAALLT